ncbi:MAG: hypothetical protein DWP97_06435 [Calditrichaeota bacterium]|nr:MAG: hypothetical protein DWP97_06435 [Calditrichota bacterium]
MLRNSIYYSLLFIFSFSFYLLTGCGDDNEVNSSSEQFTLSQFPLENGNQWEYIVSDPRVACPACDDTVTVTIIDSSTNNTNNLFEIWNFFVNDTNQTTGQTIILDSLKISWDDLLSITIKFPFKVGDYWKVNPNFSSYKDSAKVTGYGPITVSAGTFDNAFKIEGIQNTFESSTVFELWVVPDFGIVRFDYIIDDPLNSGQIYKHWELKSYMQSASFDHFTADEYPNIDGSSWTYRYLNFNYNNGVFIDSMYENIMVNLAESSTVAIWSYQYTDSTTYRYVENNTDTVFIYTDNQLTQLESKYIFPFSIEQNWTAAGQDYRIGNIISVTYDGNLYFPTYLIFTESDCGADCTVKETEYLTPSIGLIYKVKNIYNSDTDFNISTLTNTQSWELTNYFIPLSTD